MTVAGQKNHYNVKLLKGYGVSISLKDNRLCLKGGRDPFTGEQETEEWFVMQILTSESSFLVAPAPYNGKDRFPAGAFVM